ncbi:hypothetical protein G7085_02290 [Tessaracoccus sp. HDW20]|uniref:hypothetical protein n=1 Tax=Tessaracoccus coleopterorum TaxID=2714950 RepID=UPI0018D2FAD2|nr:hypothetical protein [Tessaracoccus coleopterorum]NHB83896.1 hypothetical protein [Tessaracoccus coleopterorum]
MPTPVLSPVPTPVRWPSTTPSATASTPALTEGITLGGANLWMPAGATIAVHPDGSLTVTLPVGAALVGVDGADRQEVAGRVLLADGGLLTRPIATLADGDLARAPFVDGERHWSSTSPTAPPPSRSTRVPGSWSRRSGSRTPGSS